MINFGNFMIEQQNNITMSKSKKLSRNKPNLFVEIEDFEKKISDFKDGNGKNNVTIKPLRSDKNAHELKRFNFDDSCVDRVTTERKMQKLQQLQEQKCNLMHSLEILKASAVSAIAEKEDQIEKLKIVDHFNLEEKLEFYENELYLSQKIQRELQQQKDQLYREFSQERSKHLSQLEEKEYLIEAMQEEMAEIRRDLQTLEQNDLAKTKKIKLLQQENSKLSIQLEELSLANSLSQINDKMDLDQTIKIQPPPSVISSIHSQNCFSMIESNEHPIFDATQKSYISERIEEMNKGHKQDLMELKSFYEKRITALREIYERQLNLPTEESQKEQTLSRSSHLTKKPSKRSLRNKRINQQSDYGMNLNLHEMYAIQEHAQQLMETERTKMNDLKYEIKMQNLSECPSVEPRLRTQEDMMDAESATSHFTAKYFQMPINRFLKKNKSSSTFNPEESKTILKVNHSSNDDKYDAEELHNYESSENFWSKTKVFAAGMISGVTITALTALFLKRNR